MSSLWADERVSWPVHVTPYTPACRLAKGKTDPGFRTKPQLAADLVGAARKAGIGFRAVVADCFYGDNVGFTEALGAAKVAYVLAVKPRKGVWAPADEAHTPREAARQLAWSSPEEPGDWARWCHDLSAEEVKALGRPAMDYTRTELRRRLTGWLNEQYLRWLHPTSGRRPGEPFL